MVMDSSQFLVIWTNKKRDRKVQEKLIEAMRSDFILHHMSSSCWFITISCDFKILFLFLHT